VPDEERNGFGNPLEIVGGEMCWCDIRGAYADKVTGVADNKCFLEGVGLDSSAVLEGLRISKCNNTCNAIFDVLRQTFHSAISDGCSLAVSYSHNFGLGEVDSHISEDLYLVNPVRWRAARVEIGFNQ